MSSVPFVIPVAPGAAAAGFQYPPVVLASPAGEPVELIETLSSATPPADPGAGDRRWIEETTRIEFQWDAALERWVEFLPSIFTVNFAGSISSTTGVATFGTPPTLDNEVVLSAFRVSGQGIATATDYYQFFPALFRVGSGVRTDLTAYDVTNLGFADTNFNTVERIGRTLFAAPSRIVMLTVRSVRVGNAANFGNATFALAVHRVRLPA